MKFDDSMTVIYTQEPMPDSARPYDVLRKMIRDIPIAVRENNDRMREGYIEVQLGSATTSRGSQVWSAIIAPKDNLQIIYEGLEKISSKRWKISLETNVHGTTDSFVRIKEKRKPYSVLLWGNYKETPKVK